MFVIPCKYTTNSNIEGVIEKLVELHPDDSILITDSNSTDQGYVYRIAKKYPQVQFAFNNNHFVDSAVWCAYFNFPDESHYFVLQDSMEIHSNLNEFKQYDFTSFMWFDVDYELLRRGRGWHNAEQKEYAKKSIESNTSFKFEDEFTGLFGITFISSRETLTQLHVKGLSNVLPTNKQEMCAGERIWGMCLGQIGIDIKKNSIAGNLRLQTDGTFRTKYITKYTFNRQ